MPTISLAMIVRDEAKVITRALDSVQSLVDYIFIHDTGSTDGTQTIVKEWCRENEIPCNVPEEPWHDFAFNRTAALAGLRQIKEMDYALILDADDVLQIHGDPQEIKASLTADCYTFNIYHGGLIHQRPQLIRNRKPFRYRGIVHEFLECLEPNIQAHLDTLSIKIIGGGVHSRNPESMRRDAELLEKTLEDPERDHDLDTRHCFYLAQSWRDCSELGRARDRYQQRARMRGWNEEVYVSLLNAGRLEERLNFALSLTAETYRRACELNPKRAEAFHGAARMFRLANMFHESYAIAKQGIALPLYRGLFVEEWIYRYALLDECAVSAYYAGHYLESYLASELILSRCADLDPITLSRIQQNREFARSKL